LNENGGFQTKGLRLERGSLNAGFFYILDDVTTK